MRLRPFILILLFLCLGFDVKAQLPEGLSSSSSMPEQWQLTLDVIKSKAQSLVVENNGLQVEYRQLIEEAQKLQQSIVDQQSKNEQLKQLLKQRHGRTDQQLRIEELAQTVKIKSQQANTYDEQLENLQRKKSGLDQKIQQLKYTISDIELHQQSAKLQAQASLKAVPPAADDQLIQLHKQLEDQSRQEVLLETEMGAYKTGHKAQNLNADAINSENSQLESRLDVLRLQKLKHEKESADTQLSQASARMYMQLKKRKAQLESKIYAYEAQMEGLRQSSLMALSWPLKKKRMIHEMVQKDARNNQMRGQIKALREDIDILKDQVAKLERRVDFSQGNAGKQ